MMRDFRRWERGQAAVITAFVMVGLLVAAGLAIDGGMGMLERRRMQNAADASALAGTRKLAAAIFSNDDTLDGDIQAAVVEYAKRNGVEDASDVVADYVDVDLEGEDRVVGRVGEEETIPTDASGISTTTTITRNVSFMGLLGFDRARASAQALAVLGPPLGGGVRPFGVPQELFVSAEKPYTRTYSIDFSHCPEKKECLEDSYIYDQSTEPPKQIAQHRGWLDLNYIWNDQVSIDESDEGWPRALSSDEEEDHITDWMVFGKTVDVWEGDYIHALSGGRESLIKDLTKNKYSDLHLVTEEYPDEKCGDTMYVPVYDRIDGYEKVKYCDSSVLPEEWPDVCFLDPGGDPEGLDELPDATQEENTKPAPSPGGGSWYYHVVDLASVCVVDTGQHQIYFKLIDLATIVSSGDGSLNDTIAMGEGRDSNTFEIRLWRIDDS